MPRTCFVPRPLLSRSVVPVVLDRSRVRFRPGVLERLRRRGHHRAGLRAWPLRDPHPYRRHAPGDPGEPGGAWRTGQRGSRGSRRFAQGWGRSVHRY
ncbi:hypothetical protein KIH74_05380 [Kineosporia sp. J2-2]|uniref:Uncharacterized protein n=1 Tax=Kineosporia corallincola TaxID=2835133 RepID=A0ABS5TD47_9ACTN|nr:hypothetical protein [Kineosporia corallincola]MBT0768344.1 hypothetical protein [Kineosporia corallincola]